MAATQFFHAAKIAFLFCIGKCRFMEIKKKVMSPGNIGMFGKCVWKGIERKELFFR